jgi:hypothetical protein
VALVVIAAGVLASACDVTPPAATANGTSISVATLNSQLNAYANTSAGECLLQLEEPQLSSISTLGDGGPGTYSMSYTNAVLKIQIEDLLAVQYAQSKGLDVTTSDLSTARSDLTSTLEGEISSAVQNATSEGTTSPCETATGSALSASALLSQLPASIGSSELADDAYYEKLLSDGANLSAAAIFDYYAANKAEFTLDCLSGIVTTSEVKANQVKAQLEAGASFPSLARSESIDTETAATGGSLGCSFTQAYLTQDLQQQNISVGKPLAPVEASSTGEWAVYEVTSQTVEPLTAAKSLVQKELLQATANVDRVNNEIVAFAHRSSVSIDPQYGTWSSLSIVPPTAPPADLLPTASGSTPATVLPGGSTGTTGSTGSGAGTSGSSSTSNG